MTAPLGRRLLAEFLGSAFLAALVIGSGIAAQQLSQDTGLQLLENAAATAAGLFAIILMFGADLRRALQPGRLARRRRVRRPRPPRRARLHPRPDRRVHRRRGRRQRDVRAGRGEHLHTPPGEPGAPARRGDRDARAAARHLRPGADRPRGGRARGGRRLHRRGLLLHELDELRQPGDHRRADVLGHLRGDRAGVGAGLRRRAAGRRGGRPTRFRTAPSGRCRLPPRRVA